MRALSMMCVVAVASACSSADDGDGSPSDSVGGDGDASSGDAVNYEDYDAVVTVGATCPAHVACGGDISGKWYYTDVCHVAEELFADIYESCEAAEIFNVEADSFTGWVQFQAGAMTRDIHATLNADIDIPISCTFGFCDCGAVEGIINQSDGLSGSCATACVNNACQCAVTFTVALTDTGTYTTAANQVTITTNPSTGPRVTTYDYCAHASDLTYKDAAAMSPESGTYTLKR